MADDAKLISSELITNAVRHGEGPIRLCLRLTIRSARRKSLRIDVSDQGTGWGDNFPTLPIATSDNDDGRGLLLVDALSTAWGGHRIPNGYMVWAELDIAA